MTAARGLAWAVHAYTASGLILAALMAVLIVRGGEAELRLALLLMWLATLVDATDGWLARRARAAEALPSFDGRRLDDIVDFHTYTSLPLLLVWRAGILPGGLEWFLLAPLLASAYGFSRCTPRRRRAPSWDSPPTGTWWPSTSTSSARPPGPRSSSWEASPS